MFAYFSHVTPLSTFYLIFFANYINFFILLKTLMYALKCNFNPPYKIVPILNRASLLRELLLKKTTLKKKEKIVTSLKEIVPFLRIMQKIFFLLFALFLRNILKCILYLHFYFKLFFYEIT